MKKKLLLIFVLAFLIRLINLNQSLWLDEATTARVVQQHGFWEILTEFSPHDFHPPLFYWLMKLWTNFFGYSEISLRMSSVIFSLLTGYIVYLIGGAWSLLFFLFNPLVVYYSQEARMYMMTTFLLTTSLYFFIKIQKIKSEKLKVKNYNLKLKFFFVLFNAFLILAFFTFYGSIFFIAAILIYFLFQKKYKYLMFTICSQIFAFLIIGPLLYQQLVSAKVSLATVINWSLVLGKANVKNLLLIPIKFSVGRIDFYPKGLYYLIAGLWTTLILIQSLKFKVQTDSSKLKIPNLLLFLFITPLLLGFVVSFLAPMMQYFRFLYLIPILSILLSFSLLGQDLIHRSGGYIIGLGFLLFSLIYLFIPSFHREDWKSLVKSLPAGQPVYMIKSSSDPVTYYNPKLKINELESLSSLSNLPKSLILIPYTAEIYGYNYQQQMRGKGYYLSERKNFRNVYFERWLKKT